MRTFVSAAAGFTVTFAIVLGLFILTACKKGEEWMLPDTTVSPTVQVK